jgi:hypothetical protein
MRSVIELDQVIRDSQEHQHGRGIVKRQAADTTCRIRAYFAQIPIQP